MLSPANLKYKSNTVNKFAACLVEFGLFQISFKIKTFLFIYLTLKDLFSTKWKYKKCNDVINFTKAACMTKGVPSSHFFTTNILRLLD